MLWMLSLSKVLPRLNDMKLNPNNPQEFTMTIEGRPEIDFDWKAEYVKQRKDRLCDAVHDYLDDADASIL